MINNTIFSIEELKELKSSKDPTVKLLLKKALEEAEAATGKNMPSLAFAYYMTGKKEYFDKARAYMLKTSKENDEWYSDEYDPPRYAGYDIHTDLPTFYRVLNMAEGLVLFGDLLQKEEFDLFLKATHEKGILPILEEWVLPGTRMHALDSIGHNYWAVILSGCASAITLLYDYIPDSERLLNAAKNAVIAWFEYKGNPLNAKPATFDNGGYYESIDYFDFSLHEYLTFAAAYKRMFGVSPFDDTELLMQAADFALNTYYPSSKGEFHVPFGDTGNDVFLHTPFSMLKYGLDHPGLRWYVQQPNLPSSFAIEKLLAWHNVSGKSSAMPNLTAACYDKIGWAVMKSSNEPDADMLCIKCGDTWNHAHADAGHFTLFRNGDTEINDSYSGPYSSPNYISYFTDSHAHNVLLFEGKGQDFRDNYKNHAHLPGKLYNFRNENGFRYVVADATGPMSRYFRKHHRHFIWLDGFVLIYDDAECYENGTVNYLLHANEENCHRMLTKCEVSEEKGFKVYKPENREEKCTYFSFNRKTDDEGHVRFASLLLLNENLKYTFDENKDDWQLDIGEYTIHFNHRADGKVAHRNCIVTMGGYITDALLLILKNGTPFAVVNGSIVRNKDGTKSSVESLFRITGRI